MRWTQIQCVYLFPVGYTQAAKVPQDWLDMTQHCKDEVRRQIQVEIDATVQYMAMGAHFAQVSVNRPGFSELFFKASGEEREHAGKLISYLLMRGELASNVTGLITINVSQRHCSTLIHVLIG